MLGWHPLCPVVCCVVICMFVAGGSSVSHTLTDVVRRLAQRPVNKQRRWVFCMLPCKALSRQPR